MARPSDSSLPLLVLSTLNTSARAGILRPCIPGLRGFSYLLEDAYELTGVALSQQKLGSYDLYREATVFSCQCLGFALDLVQTFSQQYRYVGSASKA